MKDRKKTERREILIDLSKSTLLSICMALAIFSLSAMVLDLRYGGTFHLENYQFTKMVLGSVIIGLGYGLPTLIYRKDNLPLPIRAIIHMGIGCMIYTGVASYEGWLPQASSPLKILLILLFQLGLAFFIWFLFLRYYRKEARELNERIQERKTEGKDRKQE